MTAFLRPLKYLVLGVILPLSACTSLMQVGYLDPHTGYLQSKQRAEITKSKTMEIDDWKSLVLVSGGNFAKEQTIALGYFDEVMDVSDLEVRIVQAGLQDKITSVQDRIGINNAYRHYKKFLWLRFDTRKQGASEYVQLILTNPETFEDCFVAERYLDYRWAGINDQITWYPLYNGLIDYIKTNSKTYRRGD